MGDYTTLMARDGHEFQAWLAAPQGAARGAVVVLQEIFGLNSHIRAVTDRFAAEGYLAIAPSLFDRVRRDLQLGYTAEDVEQGRGTMKQLDQAKVTLDVLSALNVVKHAGRVAAVGYCWGGTQAYLAACDQPVACAVAYYGTAIASNLHKHPRAPVLYHFGERDKTIPPDAIARIRENDPSGQVFVYPADHGFNCDQRASYDAESARLARERTLAFLAQYLTGQ
ncbi:dienelactone hydrolase family protein [bacterium]|nr:MAG: dienelactone hydrolase family protein [bacterium]